MHRPTRTILKGDKEKAATHAGDAKRALFQLRSLEAAGSNIHTLRKQCADGSKIKVHSKVAGMDVVEIESFGGEKREEKVVSRVKYIAPALCCYSWLAAPGNYYRNSVPEAFAIFKDVNTLTYVYKPTAVDVQSVAAADTYIDTYGEWSYKVTYGSANKILVQQLSPGRERRVKITELYAHYDYEESNDNYNLDSTVSNVLVTTDGTGVDSSCPQYDTWSLVFTYSRSDILTMYETTLATSSIARNGTAGLSITSHSEPTESCPYGMTVVWEYDYQTFSSFGSTLYDYKCAVVNKNLPTNSDEKHFPDGRNGYAVIYSDESYSSAVSGPGTTTNGIQAEYDNNMPRTDTHTLYVFSRNAKTGKEYVVTEELFKAPPCILRYEEYDITTTLDLFYYNGEVVCLLLFMPKYNDGYTNPSDEYYNKYYYVMIYRGIVYRSSRGFDSAGNYDKPHVIYDSNGKTIILNDKQYYASGYARMVEVEETIVEITQ